MNEPLQLGRYSLLAQLASGGMAAVYLGRLNGEEGFGRPVAIKRLHPHLAEEPQFVSMFLDEARLAARIQHPNVVPTLDVVKLGRELFIVMEYVRGESLAALLKVVTSTGVTIPVPVVAAITIGVLNGLHAAHEAADEQGNKLWIVHRDVSPQNVLVGTDGVARVFDFGIAKAAMRLQSTREGQLKGKLAYMAPEQLSGEASHRTDIYSAGIVLWEMLTCRRLITGETEAQLLRRVTGVDVKPPSRHNDEVTPEIDRIVLKALAKDPADRYPSARAMSEDLDRAVRPASSIVVADWVESLCHDSLVARSKLVADLESRSSLPRLAVRSDPADDTPTQPFRGDDDAETATIAVGVQGSPPVDPQTSSRVVSLTGDARTTEAGGRAWVSVAVAVATVSMLIGGAFLMKQRSSPPSGVAAAAAEPPEAAVPLLAPSNPAAVAPDVALPLVPPLAVAPSTVAPTPSASTGHRPSPRPLLPPPPTATGRSINPFGGPRK